MKTTNQIKTWLNRFRKSSGMGRFCRLVATTADAFRIEHLVPVPANPQLVVEFAPAVQFNPRLNFRRPALDSLKDSGALHLIQLHPPATHRVAAQSKTAGTR